MKLQKTRYGLAMGLIVLLCASCSMQKEASDVCPGKWCQYRAKKCRCVLIKVPILCAQVLDKNGQVVDIYQSSPSPRLTYRFDGIDAILEAGSGDMGGDNKNICIDLNLPGTYHLKFVWGEQVIEKSVTIVEATTQGNCASCTIDTVHVSVQFQQ